MTTPAGWYDDGSGRQRWWDGQQWTEHVVTAPQTDANPTTDSAAEPDSDPAREPDIEQSTTPSVEPPAAEHDAASPESTATATVSATEPAPFTPPYSPTSSTPTDQASPSGFGYPPAPGYPAAPGYQASQGYPATQGYPPTQGYPATQGYPPAQGAPWPAQATPAAPPAFPVIGVIGLAAVVIGVVCACIPVIAIVGWGILALGIVLSIVSLFLRGRKWPGITGLGVGAVGAVLAIAVSLLVGITSSVEGDGEAFAVPSERPSAEESSAPTDPADIEGAEMTTFDDLRVGDCLPFVDYTDVDAVFELPVVPCDQPHSDEVYFIFDLDGTDFPGDTAVTDAAWDGCLAEFESFVGVSYEQSELDFYNYQPTKSTWIRSGDRTVQCILFSYDDVTGTLRDAGY